MPSTDRPRTRLDRLRDALPGWAGGVLTGLQGVLLSYLVVLAPAMAAVAGAPNLDGSATVDWAGAAGVATRVWLLGLGVPLPIEGGAVSLVPLGLPLLMAAILAAVARRFATKTWTSWALAVITFATGAGLVASAAPHGPTAVGPEVAQATLTAAFIAMPSVAIGVWRAYGARLRVLDRVPDEVRAGLRLAAVTLALVIGAAALAGGVWAVLGRDAMADTASSLGMDPLGGIALAAAEILYVPTLIAWMVAYAVGAGFVVGDGTVFSPTAVTPGALPDVPLLGALPSAAGGWWVWAPAVVAALALAARLLLWRRIGRDWASARAAGTALVAVAAGLGAIAGLSSGSLGAGRLAHAGVDALPMVAIGTALVAGGYAIAWGLVWAVAWVRGRGDDAPVEKARPEPVGAVKGG